MPFTAHELRYQPEQSYPLLYAFLHRNAQRYLGAFKYDAFEVDTVIGHVVEQLVRLGLLGGGDRTPLSALDRLSDAQFYTFLSRSVRNKAIDRLRKRRLQVSTSSELDTLDGSDDDDPLDDAVESIWGTAPFATPEQMTLHCVSQKELQSLLKHCIMRLGAAPHQLQAVVQELRACGADELLQTIIDELHLPQSDSTPDQHMSQHKDHAHKKLRSCLQHQSTNLAVMVALRLIQYKQLSAEAKDYTVDIRTLAQTDLSDEDVQAGLRELTAEGMLDWQGKEHVHFTSAQLKRLARFYREE